MNPLVSLFGQLVAYGGEKHGVTLFNAHLHIKKSVGAALEEEDHKYIWEQVSSRESLAAQQIDGHTHNSTNKLYTITLAAHGHEGLSWTSCR